MISSLRPPDYLDFIAVLNMGLLLSTRDTASASVVDWPPIIETTLVLLRSSYGLAWPAACSFSSWYDCYNWVKNSSSYSICCVGISRSFLKSCYLRYSSSCPWLWKIVEELSLSRLFVWFMRLDAILLILSWSRPGWDTPDLIPLKAS
jgi:hypothetical protein